MTELNLKFVNIIKVKCVMFHFLDLNAARMVQKIKTITVTLLDVNMALSLFHKKPGTIEKNKKNHDFY